MGGTSEALWPQGEVRGKDFVRRVYEFYEAENGE